jgi:hypothetical protein
MKDAKYRGKNWKFERKRGSFFNFFFHVYAITLVNSGHNRYDLEVFPQYNDTSYQVIII